MKGRRALVTGGAGGIGAATAKELMARGASVVLLDRDEVMLSRTTATDGVAATIVADVSDAASVARAVASASVQLGGSIDLLVNAAGIYRIRPAVELGVEEWDEVLSINLRGTWLVSREVAKPLLASGRSGSVVCISSTAALVADVKEPAVHYSASKAGVLALVRQLAAEWAPGIRVNAVCPGYIDTPMLRMMDDAEAGQAVLDSTVPLRRLGQPEEVARTIAFLASDAAAYITGAAIPVDGGAMAL